MPLESTAEVMRQTVAAGRGVAAFNVITLEHVEAVAMGAEDAAVPAILQVSENAVAFHGGNPQPLADAARAVARVADVPLSLHLDHVEDDALLWRAAECGFSSVMFDASRLSYHDNIEATRGAAEWAHAHDLLCEAELGEVGGKDGAHAPWVRTDPAEAQAFVERTGVDALAVAVGSSHAMIDRTARLDQELIATLRRSVPVPLVLHGSSGVADDDLSAAVAHGIVKVNIGTALNVAFTQAVRDYLEGHPDAVDPRKYGKAARAAMAKTVARFARVVATPPPRTAGPS